MGETKQCPHCGLVNDVGRSVCDNCNTPLTGYGGQLGQEENYRTRAAEQVAALQTRPPAVIAMAVFNIVFALLWPLRSVVAAFAQRPRLNEEGTNVILVATGTLGPIFACAVFFPIAAVLFILTYMTWTQRTWTWNANLVVLGLSALVAIFHSGFHFGAFVWIIAAGVIAFFWFQRQTMAWFGFS